MIRLRHTSSLCTPIYNNFMWNTREDLTKLTRIPMYNNFIRKTRDARHVIFYFCKIIFDVTPSKSTMSICMYIYGCIGIGSKTRVPLELGLLVWYVIRSFDDDQIVASLPAALTSSKSKQKRFFSLGEMVLEFGVFSL